MKRFVINRSVIQMGCSLVFLLWSHWAIGQDRTITGTVYDINTKEALIGANVQIQGDPGGTVTDFDGEFSIQARTGDILVVSYIGYDAFDQEITAGKDNYEIGMAEGVLVDEVVVVGYGTQKKADLTGSVAVLDVKDMISQPTADVANQLQGRAAGVTVINSGQPGEAPKVRIRGINTFGNNNPLYVVDGVPTDNINTLNPNDIESMQVLKDASSASIYGARASNGVIIITTKNGEKGKVKVSLNSFYGRQVPKKGNVWDIMKPIDQANLKWLALKNSGKPLDDAQYGSGPTPTLPDFIQPNGASRDEVDFDKYFINPKNANDPKTYRIVEANKEGTDWFHEIFNPAPMMSHNLSVSGGDENSTFLISGSYFDQKGTMINTYLKRYTLRANSKFNIGEHVRVGENLALSFTDNPRTGILSEGSPIGMAYRIKPIIPVYDYYGKNYAGTFGSGLGNAHNPVALAERTRNNKGHSKKVFGNVFGEVDFLKNFTFRTSIGGALANGSYHSFSYPTYERSENTLSNSFSESSWYNINWTWTNTVNYTLERDIHSLKVLLGTEAYHNSGREVGGTTQDYFSFDPNFTNLGTGAGQKSNYSYGYEDALYSLIGRVDYTLNQKYIVSGTLRRDGSSRFAERNRYGVFPAVSAGWRISQESFMAGTGNWLSDLKIRGGWGIMGNQINIGGDNAFTTFSSALSNTFYDITGSNSSLRLGYRKNRIGNPDAKWESNINSNIGFDATLFDGRFDMTLDYYRKDVEDLLYSPELAGTAGTSTPPTVNIASMTNSGIDLFAGTRGDLTSDLSYNLSLTFTSYKNEIVSIADGVDYFGQTSLRFSDPIIRNQVGSSISAFYGYNIIGFWDTEAEIEAANQKAQQVTGNENTEYQTAIGLGRFKYEDTNGDGIITPDDRQILGNPNPDFSYGLNVGLNYKDFDLSVFFYGVQGNTIFNYVRWWTDFYPSFVGAKSYTALNKSWTPDNKNAVVAIQEDNGNFSTNGVPNSYYLEDGSYFRAKNIILGYTLPVNITRKFSSTNLRIYLQATNLFTATKYSGIDPEISGSDTSFGIDAGAYPTQKEFIFGINLSF
ncbi:TonB-dependent receptor [Membranicola marinus]|uniref:TonB-dependent receptor n=1 Tax=Membranihabitans marinus TaxID=1227546 RepID=A0A953HSI5_9BACT|nr:TonB-dependent receptor [Membranihabitans marinus]MBY5957575.1 TonB-dependent receptor [Membranihabitans marinus]